MQASNCSAVKGLFNTASAPAALASFIENARLKQENDSLASRLNPLEATVKKLAEK